MPNYFQLLNLPENYDVDLDLLAKNYRALQAEVHPDRFANANAAEKRLALQYSSMANDAEQTLKSPLKRAIYLLKLHDVIIDFEKDTKFSAEFLMEQMELREQLDEQRDLSALDAKLKQRQQKIMANLQELFAKQDWLAVKEAVKELMFFEKLLREMTLRIEKI